VNELTCEACGDKYGKDEPPQHPHLCPYCAAVIDRQTKERKENDWFE
jgi:hypothetical protein